MKHRLFVLIILLFSKTLIYCQNAECEKFNELGMLHYNNKEYIKALKDFENLIDCSPTYENYYNASCVASLADDTTKGFKFLQKAIEYGYADTSNIFNDPDLNNLRLNSRWALIPKWIDDLKKLVSNEISNLKSTCPASNILPYFNGNWGYLNKTTKKKLTNPIFREASFIGKSGQVKYGQYHFYFDCNGQIIKTIIWTSPIEEVLAAYSNDSKMDTNLKKGFKLKNKNEYSYSSIYEYFDGITVNSTDHYGIVKEKQKYSLIDSSGNITHNAVGLSFLSFYNYGNDSEIHPDNDENGDFLFFFKNSTGSIGFIDDHFDKILMLNATEIKGPLGDGFEREYLNQIRKFIYIKERNKWGIWNCESKKWVIRPEYDEIVKTERTYNGYYENYYYRGETINLYFLVRQNKKVFYIDLENNKYIMD